MTSLFKTSDLPSGGLVCKNKTKKIKATYDIRLGKRYQTVVQAIGILEMGKSIHYASMGEWSNHELLQHILDQVGPAKVYFCTWSVSENAIRQMVSNLQSGCITQLTGVLDWRVKIRRPKVLALMEFNFSRLRMTSCHAKVFVVKNKEYQIAVVGSANFTNNPRIEAGIICCDACAAQFHKNWIVQEYKNSDPFDERKISC